MENDNQNTPTATPNSDTSDSGGGDNKLNPILLAIVVVIVIAILGFIFWRGQNSGGSEETTEVDQISEQSPVGEAIMDGEEVMEKDGAMMEGEEDTNVVNVEIEAGSFYFSPNVINAKVGDTVRVTINAVDLQHDFVIDELDVQSDLVTGSSSTFEFVASEAGQFEFYCSVGNHRAQGMVGTLIVE